MNRSIFPVLFLLVASLLPAQTFDELYQKAYASAQGNQAAAALPIVEQAIAKDGNRWEGHYLRGLLLLSLGRQADALASAQQAAAKAPADQQSQVGKLLDRCKAAAAPAAPAPSANSAKAAALVQEGQAARKENKRALAARKFAEAYAADPAQALAGLDAAVTFLQLEDQAEALRLLRRLVTSDVAGVAGQAQPLLHNLKETALPELRKKQDAAMQALQSQDTAGAEKLLTACDELWPDDGGTRYLRTKLLVQQKKVPEALVMLQQAVAAGFDRVDLLKVDADVAVLAKGKAAATWLEEAFGPKLLAALKAMGQGPALGAKITTSIGLVMLPVAAQTFTMGSPASEPGRENDETQHRVTISKSFWLAETEVTQRQWRDVMGTQPWQGQSYTASGDDVAATYVSWQDVVEFCSKLTERERAAGRLPAGHVYRLPTEAQWELAARAGSGASYCFGDDVAQLGNFAVYTESRNGQYAHAVKSRRANALGFFDMHGNVWEWCADVVNYDSGVKSDAYFDGAVDPIGRSGSQRVFRGGCWNISAGYCRSAFRNSDEPGYRRSNLGFRPALAASSDK